MQLSYLSGLNVRKLKSACIVVSIKIGGQMYDYSSCNDCDFIYVSPSKYCQVTS